MSKIKVAPMSQMNKSRVVIGPNRGEKLGNSLRGQQEGVSQHGRITKTSVKL